MKNLSINRIIYHVTLAGETDAYDIIMTASAVSTAVV